MLPSVLIANRGEIACRVIRTARNLGMRTIAVFSEADSEARHVKLADEAFCIGEAPATQSYLKGETILEVAHKAGAACIHPGYGFLSENAEFAQACEAAGLVFVGPSADAIRAMGLKDAAKSLMQEAGVPVVPGYQGADQDPELLASEAARIGYPVLIKAVAGGGGKGMRKVLAAEDFPKALQAAQREAGAAFKNDRVLVEKFVARPRHIEIQVFADTRGNVVHLFERDCSLQRRHQKVIEEAPAPGMSAEMREAMGAAAIAVSKAISYRGAGTVEFIVDASQGLRPDAFYFMEMNTRLQVEHPVTEMITGQDLVEWQFRVAAGEALPLTQAEASITGHAVEARIYAENPARKFMPSTGTLHRLRLPQENGYVRVDTGVLEGDTVSMFYDPMIAKLVCWAPSRTQALQRLRTALQGTGVAGVRSNVAFLAEIAGNQAFAAGEIDTGFIDRHLDDLLQTSLIPPVEIPFLAALYEVAQREKRRQAETLLSGDRYSPWAANDGWQSGGPREERLSLFDERGERIDIDLCASATGWSLSAGSRSLHAEAVREDGGELHAVLEGQRYQVGVVEGERGFTLLHNGVAYGFDRPDPLDVAVEDAGDMTSVTAPMSGKIIQVCVEAGSRVRKGDALIILEAMKMEQTLQAAGEGVVASVHAQAGDQVEGGSVLVVFDPPQD